VVSDAGARATYLRLLDPSVPVPFRDALARVPPGYANVTLYLGLSRSPAEIGVTGANHWLFADADHDATWRRRNSLVEGDPSFAYLSFPSMKDPEAKVHAAQVVAQLDASAFAAWADRPWMRRGADYEALKQRIADALIAFVDRRVPGLAGLVETRELSTPLSTAHFTGHFGGEIYGLPATPARFASPWAQIGTPVKGLYLTGADAVAHGFGGALMSGMLTVGAMEGLVGLAKVLWATRSRDAD
jgi:phytoene dehydrogenase-like protein